MAQPTQSHAMTVEDLYALPDDILPAFSIDVAELFEG